MFCCFCVYIPTSKFGGNRINSLWILSLYRSLQCPLQPEKSWIEKTALSRRVIFTSGQNLKPPILCQYLIFFNDFSFTFVISFGSLLEPKNRNLKKIADLKVYCNLKLPPSVRIHLAFISGRDPQANTNWIRFIFHHNFVINQSCIVRIWSILLFNTFQ